MDNCEKVLNLVRSVDKTSGGHNGVTIVKAAHETGLSNKEVRACAVRLYKEGKITSADSAHGVMMMIPKKSEDNEK